MSYSLYLDDERFPKTDRNWLIARTVDEAKSIISINGFPSYISLDHDLQTEETGYDFVKWLVEYDLDNNIIPDDFTYNLHTANSVGRDNMGGLLNHYLKYKKEK